MSYVVLARKWRPQSFADLVGQEHVSTTLENALATGRVAHAFLFTGVRGVGKTTSARILAKALNCEKGPTAKPCQTCAACTEITTGADVDVQEIDGASYNGVDEVRRLQENLPYRPQRDRFKIFIVDEVHMLSNAAWNAFLKTLEEPPPHVKFIFATTEVHKVPITILSRCQRYDFKLIGAQQVAARLRWVLEQEKVAADEAAISIVAREAAGSMRDAMSLLDQVLAWLAEGERLTADGVAKVLGVAARSVLHRIAAALVDGDAPTTVQVVGELAQQGFDLPHVARDLLAHLRDLVVAKVCAEPGPLLDLADDEVRDVKALAARADADDLTRLHLGFSKAFDDIARSGQPRASLEMTLVRLARRPPLIPVEDLVRRLAELERRIERPGAAAPGRAAAGPTRPNAPMEPRERAPAGRRPQPAGATEPTEPNADVEGPPAAAPAAPAHFARSAAAPTEGTAEEPSPAPAPAPAPRTPAPAAGPASFTPPTFGDFTPRPRPDLVPSAVTAPAESAPSETEAAVGPPSAPPLPARRGSTISRPSPGSFVAAPATDLPAGWIEAWRAIVAAVRAQRAALASVLEHALLLDLGPERVRIGYPDSSFLGVHATEKVAREVLEKAVHAHFGAETPVEIDLGCVQTGTTLAQIEAAARRARIEAARKAIADHPLVAAAVELLGAELKDVRLSPELADG